MARSLNFIVSIVISLFTPAAMSADNQNISSPANLETSGNLVSMTVGIIKKIDKEAAKLTIKHEELKNLDMPAMTMVFQVKNLSMLDQIKVGDRVGFVAMSIGGKLTITELESELERNEIR